MRFNEHTLPDHNGNILVKTFHSKVLPEKRIYKEHHHTECELSLFISGSGIYRVCDREYSFSPGDMFLFGSNETHCITQINEELNLLNIYFNPRILWESSESVILLRLFSARSKTFSNKFFAKDETLKNIILNTEKEMTDMDCGYTLQVRYMLFSALTHIMRTYDYTHNESFLAKNTSVTAKLREAVNYIDENLFKPVRVSL